MKKLIFPALAVLSMLAVSCSNDETTTSEQATSKTLYISNGLVRGWSEAGNCLSGYGNCALAITGGTYTGEQNVMPVKLQLQGTTLIIDNLINKHNDDGNFLKFNVATQVPTQIANELQKNSITILKGRYGTDFSVNPNGRTAVNIQFN